MYTTGRKVWLYDWQAACKLARKDGWDAEPYGAPNRIQRAVLADFHYCAGWLNDQWHWVGVGVHLLDQDGEPRDDYDSQDTVWGIKSNSGEYLAETASELANGILASRAKAWRTHLQLARERRRVERLAEVMAGVLA